MRESSPHEVTELLQAWCEGKPEALEELVPLVYQDLHRAAARYMAREHPDHTLQATALVNEVYVRLVDIRTVSWQNRAHFFAICAKLMRRILTDFARSRFSLKRGAGAPHVTFDEALVLSPEPCVDLLALDDAMKKLAAIDERKSRVVELRFFAGLSVEETAGVLHVSPETIARDWRLAKVWLLREMTRENGNGA
ncbi:MAG: sigma-70 family RNA polymerase sigma factor [Acidobacteriota bacterium]|nr:sigma-70 family RNA polymerase sigma factor [Acidobacteriota bacterium]